MKLQPNEHDLSGAWIQKDNTLQADAVSARIEWLTSHHLKKIASSKQWGDWEVLYQDPDDGRYWERTFPQGELQGGGPPRLAIVDLERVRSKYQIPL
ncbi:MAG: hypothetical protein HZA32_02630 [Opitutae bacterium]|nr:hypothetical protein [Opitutae bacterium]